MLLPTWIEVLWLNAIYRKMCCFKSISIPSMWCRVHPATNSQAVESALEFIKVGLQLRWTSSQHPMGRLASSGSVCCAAFRQA